MKTRNVAALLQSSRSRGFDLLSPQCLRLTARRHSSVGCAMVDSIASCSCSRQTQATSDTLLKKYLRLLLLNRNCKACSQQHTALLRTSHTSWAGKYWVHWERKSSACLHSSWLTYQIQGTSATLEACCAVNTYIMSDHAHCWMAENEENTWNRYGLYCFTPSGHYFKQDSCIIVA